jgi:DNA-directed RNA polymerase subunit RPC12/RpoP
MKSKVITIKMVEENLLKHARTVCCELKANAVVILAFDARNCPHTALVVEQNVTSYQSLAKEITKFADDLRIYDIDLAKHQQERAEESHTQTPQIEMKIIKYGRLPPPPSDGVFGGVCDRCGTEIEVESTELRRFDSGNLNRVVSCPYCTAHFLVNPKTKRKQNKQIKSQK